MPIGSESWKLRINLTCEIFRKERKILSGDMNIYRADGVDGHSYVKARNHSYTQSSVNHRNRIFGFRPNMNLRQLEITEYSAENEYSVIFGNYRIFGKLLNIRQVTEYFTVSGTTNS